ncbi:hypothetical protein Tco_1377292 [Tanacetum coccineum]
MILSEKRPVIKTLKYSDRYKKLLDSVLFEKLKLDGEIELEEEEAKEEMVKEYKAIKEKEEPGVFVLPIRLEAKLDLHALADIGSNINAMPYRIFAKLRRDNVKLVEDGIIITEYLVNISKSRAFWSLNEDILMIIVLTTNTPYPYQGRYRISVPLLTKRPQRWSILQETSGRYMACEYSGRYQTWSILQETLIRRIQPIGYAVSNRLPDSINRKLKNEF